MSLTFDGMPDDATDDVTLPKSDEQMIRESIEQNRELLERLAEEEAE